MLGYSGRDFDICPVLFETKYRTLSWLAPPPENPQDDPFAFSAHVRFALEHPAIVQRFRLMRGTFGDVLDEPAGWISADNSGTVVDRIFANEKNSPDAFRLWATALFQAISCRKAAVEILPTVVPGTTSDILRIMHLRSDLEERSRAYLASERTLAEVARRQELEGNLNETVRANAQRCWRLFTGTHLARLLVARRRLWAMVRTIERTRPPETDLGLARARLAYVDFLVISIARFVPGGRALMRLGAIRRRLEPLLRTSLDLFRSLGLWQEHYLLAKLATELELMIHEKTVDRVLPASFGFGQLGNLVGDTSVYRRSRRHDPTRALFLLDGLRRYGLEPEYWKFYHKFREEIRKLPANSHSASAAIRAYRSCEIGWLGRFKDLWKIAELQLEARAARSSR